MELAEDELAMKLGDEFEGVAFYENSNRAPYRRIIGIYRYCVEDVEFGRKIFKPDSMGTLWWPQKPDGSWGYDEENFPLVALAVLIDPDEEADEDIKLTVPIVPESRIKKMRRRVERDSADFFGKAEPVLAPCKNSRKFRMTSTFSGKILEEKELADMNSNQEGLRAERSSGLGGYELEPTYYLIEDKISQNGFRTMQAEYMAKLMETNKEKAKLQKRRGSISDLPRKPTATEQKEEPELTE
ncbi:hypothetical protein ScalyP_jg8091 [Parmales sp. scaly parma]|nr:hypothetical protein ScalyP_jg8091 [Parmales sp. scaly parma]|tara:strand:- start:669 stop:1394 length:726 start_codon:yes stop_codon:yes gene_type:complete